MAINLAALDTFYWVARLGSFRAAGQKVGLSQPAVSYRIADLERELGVELFRRNGRSVQLTSSGASLLVHAERMIGIGQDIEAQVRVRGRTAGFVRLGVTDGFGGIALPQLLTEAERRLPEIRLSITVDTSHALTARLASGELDLAVLSTPPDATGISLTTLGRQSVGWVAHAGLRLPPQPLVPEQMMKLRIFSTPQPSNHHAIISAFLADSNPQDIRLDFCSNVAVIAGLVRAGVGISLLPLRLVEAELKAGELRVLRTDRPLPPQDVFVGQSKSGMVRALAAMKALLQEVAAAERFCDIS